MWDKARGSSSRILSCETVGGLERAGTEGKVGKVLRSFNFTLQKYKSFNPHPYLVSI